MGGLTGSFPGGTGGDGSVFSVKLAAGYANEGSCEAQCTEENTHRLVYHKSDWEGVAGDTSSSPSPQANCSPRIHHEVTRKSYECRKRTAADMTYWDYSIYVVVTRDSHTNGGFLRHIMNTRRDTRC